MRTFLIALSLLLLVTGEAALADAVNGEIIPERQPDGEIVQVRVWGDEFYRVTESLDGYTLVRDPLTEVICYAKLSTDGDRLESTGIRAGATGATRAARGLDRHLRIDDEARSAQVKARRSEQAAYEAEVLAGYGPLAGDKAAPDTGDVVGILLLIDFSDEPATIPAGEFEDYCNQVGYSTYGNNGSIYDYFLDVSDGNLSYTNYVTPVYYRAQNPKSWYDDQSVSGYTRARTLVLEALNDLDAGGFDFGDYDSNNDGYIDAINIFYAGYRTSWGIGLWPHSGGLSYYRDGVSVYRYQMTDITNTLKLRTFCHENGHMICYWPDLYDYDSDSSGVGNFCLMGYGASNYNPCEPSAPMKHYSGWDVVSVLADSEGGLTETAGVNDVYLFPHPTYGNEYYMIENRQKTDRDQYLPDAGLAIWHVDEYGSNNYQQGSPGLHYEVALVQADGFEDLEHYRDYGDTTDLWAAPDYVDCTPQTTPDTDWWSGDASELWVLDIGDSGPIMRFDFYDGVVLPNLALLWNFDEGAGTVTTDWSGHARTGTLLGGPVWVAGQEGTALSLDGLDDRISTPHFYLENVTVEAVVRMPAVPGDQHIVCKPAAGASDRTYLLGLMNGGTEIGFGGHDNDGFALAPASLIPDGVWVHLAGSYDGADFRLYVNGVEVASASAATPGALVAHDSPFIVGADPAAGQLFAGDIDMVRISGYALQPTEFTWGGLFSDATLSPLDDGDDGVGVAWADYDADGDLDIYLSNAQTSSNRLFRNEADGTFADVTAAPLDDTSDSRGVAWADHDNDGDLDLYVANDGQPNRLLRNEGGGVFTDVTSGPLGDTGPIRCFAWGDYDDDGLVDLYLSIRGGANRLLRNEGGDVFSDATTAPLDDAGLGYGVAWGDYDDDGDLDLYVANGGTANKLLRNDGGGVFSDATANPLDDAGEGRGVAWGDYDNDGDLDLYLSNSGTANRLFRNDGGGIFADATAPPLDDVGAGLGVGWADYDNDGDLDLYLVNDGSANRLLRNDGGVFADVTAVPLGDAGNGRGFAWGDHDGDGDLDLYLAGAQVNGLLRNEEHAGNGWLHVSLAGYLSNAAGIGARVSVTAGGQTQVREVSGGSGYASQNSLPVEFGLGAASIVDLVRVVWPSGVVQETTQVAVDQMLHLNEAQYTWAAVADPLLASDGFDLGAQWVDYDQDGELDLYRANPGGDSLLRQSGGAFSEVWPLAPVDTYDTRAPAWGDIDGDGYPDLYLPRWNQPNVRFTNDGAGGFIDETATEGDAGPGRCAEWIDYDRDGRLDLYLVNHGAANVMYRNAGEFGGYHYLSSMGNMLGDTGYGTDAAWSDMDNDADPDVYLVDVSADNQMMANYGELGFNVELDAAITFYGNGSMAAAWGDYDNDGWQDLYVANSGSADQLYHNDGGGDFSITVFDAIGDVGPASDVVWLDHDLDGNLDLFVARDGAANLLLENSGEPGAARFVNRTGPYSVSADSTASITCADYDGDGDLDIYAANKGSPSRLYRNDTNRGHHWLEVALVGTDSHASGAGARVRVVTGGQSRIREAFGPASVSLDGSRTVHFGLGTAATADSVSVQWPSGIVQHLVSVPCDQRLVVTESETGTDVPSSSVPSCFALHPCAPNPFNPRTLIRFDLPVAADAHLEIYDLAGRLVRTLVAGEHLPAGGHERAWSGRDRTGRPVAAGVYFYRLGAGTYTETRRMTLVK